MLKHLKPHLPLMLAADEAEATSVLINSKTGKLVMTMFVRDFWEREAMVRSPLQQEKALDKKLRSSEWKTFSRMRRIARGSYAKSP